MKIVLFSLLCLILIGMTSNSYAGSHNMTANVEFDQAAWKTSPFKGITLPEAMVQLQLRNSNGNLVAYIESEQIIGIHFWGLNNFLDKQNQTSKEFFIKDDKKYEIQQWEKTVEFVSQKTDYSIYRFLDIYQNELVNLLSMRHDSFQTQPGDTLRVFWTVIRPAS